jgi:uncharacterized membrane protein YtjA (UPF0391 family)
MKYWPHLFFFGAVVFGTYGFTGLAATHEQAAMARTVFYICAVLFLPLAIWRMRSLMRGK